VKEIKKGDHFLLPYKGTRKELLFKVIGPMFCGHHHVYYYGSDHTGEVLVSSCRRVSPSVVKRILKTYRHRDKEGK
jgi:hypothetical protein